MLLLSTTQARGRQLSVPEVCRTRMPALKVICSHGRPPSRYPGASWYIRVAVANDGILREIFARITSVGLRPPIQIKFYGKSPRSGGHCGGRTEGP